MWLDYAGHAVRFGQFEAEEACDAASHTCNCVRLVDEHFLMESVQVESALAGGSAEAESFGGGFSESKVLNKGLWLALHDPSCAGGVVSRFLPGDIYSLNDGDRGPWWRSEDLT